MINSKSYIHKSRKRKLIEFLCAFVPFIFALSYFAYKLIDSDIQRKKRIAEKIKAQQHAIDQHWHKRPKTESGYDYVLLIDRWFKIPSNRVRSPIHSPLFYRDSYYFDYFDIVIRDEVDFKWKVKLGLQPVDTFDINKTLSIIYKKQPSEYHYTHWSKYLSPLYWEDAPIDNGHRTRNSYFISNTQFEFGSYFQCRYNSTPGSYSCYGNTAIKGVKVRYLLPVNGNQVPNDDWIDIHSSVIKQLKEMIQS